jgi:methionyl-tRNA formyltransferase
MRVVSELDAGPMFAVRTRPIGPDETSVEVERALADLGSGLLLEVVDAIAEGRAVETPQDSSRATYAPKLTRGDGRIDWTLPALGVHNLVRGLKPWPLAATRLGDTRLLVHRTAPLPEPSIDVPGTIVAAAADRFHVVCGGSTTLAILEIQPEGRRAMTAREFLAGHRVHPGDRFSDP